MPPQLTVGRFQPTKNLYGVSAAGGGGGFGFRPMIAPKPPGTPGSQYGGEFMYPGMGTQGGGAPQPSAPAPVAPVVNNPQPTTTPGFWTTPDYSSMIGGAWEVGAAESMMGSQMAAARAQFQNQLRQSFIDLGYEGDKSQLGDFSKYIDKDTIQKAIDNKFSSYAQIKKQQATADAVNASLNLSSGMGVSGAVGEEAKNTLSQVEQSRYEGLRSFLSGGQTGLSNLTNMKNQLAQGVMQARFAAAQRLAAQYPPTWTDPVTHGGTPGITPGGTNVPDYGNVPVSGGTGFGQTVTWGGENNPAYWWT